MNRVRVERNKDYTTISNVFLRDKSLSLKAKGLLAMVMGLPEDWVFSISGICAIIKEGKTSVYSTIAELKDRGYCRTTDCHDASGKFAGCDYTFTETPDAETPHTENPHTDNPHTENQPQLNIDNNKLKTERKKEGRKPLTLPFSSLKFKETWETLRAMPKWKRKTQSALQMSLNKLSRYEEEFAVALMENAIAGEYQGVVFQDTDRRYQEWQRSRSSGSKPDDYPESNMAYMKRMLDEFEEEWAREDANEQGGIDEQ